MGVDQFSLSFFRVQFVGQDVMVPWHLQPKYSDRTHSVPKSSKADSAKAAAKRAKKAEKLKKKLEKREKNEKGLSGSCVKEEEAMEGEKCETGDDCLLGELLELRVDELDEQRGRDKQETASSTVKESNKKEAEPLSQDHDCSAGHGRATDTGSKTDSKRVSKTETDSVCEDSGSKVPLEADIELAAQGYRTFQRYYHVFCRGELTNLFSRVEGACVLEEFYDHENWCVLAERRNTDTKHDVMAK